MTTEPSNPILFSLPEQFDSERLHIRAPLWGDGAALNEAVIESLEQFKPWFPWAQSIPSVEDSEATVRRTRLQFLERSDLMLLLTSKQDGRLIGGSGLHRIDWPARKFEIGYWVRSTCSGQGYIAEAVAAITQFAIQELHANRIEIRCDSRNTRSAKVAERSGYTLEGVLRSEKCAEDGSLRNTMIWAKVRGIEF
ncbi:GNAT family N-acetyltransferase [Paenibacillus kobensis]|uniref:GNAT family N-acetyltransferase n=1 Tax=Paenibacillus kobensis TaxID=59841 RepID=UPI000FDC6FCA|nr:GNAT family N-acetyltransferase [Paenibacillus kobensis]